MGGWADLAQTCCLGPLALSRMLSLRLLHAMHALTSLYLFIAVLHKVVVNVGTKILICNLISIKHNHPFINIGTYLYVCEGLSHGAKDCYSLNHVLIRKFIYPSNILSVIPRVGYNRNLFTSSFLDFLVSRYF